MLRRKLCSAIKKQFNKYLSTVPLPQTGDHVQEQTDLETFPRPEVLSSPDYFKVHNLFTVKDLFDARVHYGHKITSLTPLMRPFVFGSRLGHVIFDLDKTAYHLREALNFLAHVAYRDGIVLFVSKNPSITLLVEQTAQDCKEYAVTRDWSMGTFTDSVNKFQCSVRLPDVVIILNTLEENNHEHQVITEAAKMCIPTIGIVDSNCSLNLISYPVPGNDDSFSSLKLYCSLFKEAILRGKNTRNMHLKSAKKSNDQFAETVKTDEVDVSVNKEKKSVDMDLLSIIKSQ